LPRIRLPSIKTETLDEREIISNVHLIHYKSGGIFRNAKVCAIGALYYTLAGVIADRGVFKFDDPLGMRGKVVDISGEVALVDKFANHLFGIAVKEVNRVHRLHDLAAVADCWWGCKDCGESEGNKYEESSFGLHGGDVFGEFC